MRWNWAQSSAAALFVTALVGTGVVAATAMRELPLNDAVFRVLRSTPAPDNVPPASAPEAQQPAAIDGSLLPATRTPAEFAMQEGNQGGGLEQSLRSHRVRLSNDGFLVGRLGVIDPDTGRTITAEAITITFLRQGSTVAETKPGVDGIFQAKLEPGVYSMVAAGLDGFMAFGTEVLPADDHRVGRQEPHDFGNVRLVNFFQQEVSALQIDGAMVPPKNFPVLRQLVQLYLPTGGQTVPQQAPSEAPAPKKEEATPTEDAGPAEAQSESQNPILRNHAVQLRPDGTLVGRMRRVHPQSGRPVRVRKINVFFIRDGALVAQAPVNENGSFEVRGLRTGVHSLVAAGVEGFAAFGVLIAAPPKNTSSLQQSGPIKTVANMRMANAEEFFLDISLLPPEDFQALINIVNQVLGGQGLALGLGAGAGLMQLPSGVTPSSLGGMLAAAGVGAAAIGAITGAILSNNNDNQNGNQQETSFDPDQPTAFQGLNPN